MSIPRFAVLGILVVSALAVSEATARASEIAFGTYDIPTTFFISKSDDHNRVDYGMRLDAKCGPLTDDNAVFPYWRVFEHSPPIRTQPISFIEHIPYGISEQHVLKRTDTGGEYYLKLKQLNRNIFITTKRESNGRCSSLARAEINGNLSELVSVFAKLAGPMSVDYIDVFGKHLATGAAVTERVKK